MTGRGGRVALARSGFSPNAAGEITGELGRLVGRVPDNPSEEARYAESRRIRRAAALADTRHLAADPKACDREKI